MRCSRHDIASFRQEFIFRILKHLVIGGGMSQVAPSFAIVREGSHPSLQYDDEWKPYADTVLAMCTLPLPQKCPAFHGASGTKMSSLCKGVP
jgi:hypothetical protein